MSRILVVEDESHIAEGLRFNLEAEGHSVEIAGDGEDALDRMLVKNQAFDLVLLDVMLPGKDGFSVAHELRQRQNFAPIMMLTARGRPEDVLKGFESGADDYLPKPFNPRELVARIRAVLRRTRSDKGGPSAPDIVRVGEIELDPATRSVRRDGEPVDLTSVEFNLLEVLLREAGRVVPRERLVNAVLSRKFSPFDRSIDMHVSKVRKKLGDTDNDEHIKTIRGVGYIFARPRERADEKPAEKVKSTS